MDEVVKFVLEGAFNYLYVYIKLCWTLCMILSSLVTFQIFVVVTSSQGFAKTTLHLCETVLVVLPPTGKHLLRYK